MAKFKTGLSVKDQGVAEGREAWSGELPPTGSYTGVVKVLSLGRIQSNESGNQGKAKLFVGVELRDTPGGKYDGYVAGGNLNLIEGSEAFINQFLLALTDGSDAQFTAIKKAFDNGFDMDERKKHVLRIGRVNINSPKGEVPIKVSVSNRPFWDERAKESRPSVRIESYLLNGDSPSVRNGAPEEVIEDAEVEIVEEDDSDDDILDD